MELSHLRYFVAVAGELNVRQAATRLHLSGQKHLYSFAVLLRELPGERRWELVQRSKHWPDPLAEQVARVVRGSRVLVN